MIKFEYEDVIEYLKADIDKRYPKENPKWRLEEVSKYKYNSYKIDKSSNKITLYHPKYWGGDWIIKYNLFQSFLRQKRIDKFLNFKTK